MKVHLIKEKTIRNFANEHPNSISSFEDWLSKLKVSDWNSPDDISKTFASADILGKGTNRVVFDIGGNNYRMICTYRFRKNRIRLYVNWIGTHSEYDKLCKTEKQYSIEEY